MTIGPKGNYLLAVAALVLSGALALAWVAARPAGAESRLLRAALLGGSLVLVGGSAAVLWHRGKSDRRALMRHFEALCQLDPNDIHSDINHNELPPLEQNSPWKPLADRVRETMLGYCRRLQDLEHTRTALEIRARRAGSQHEQIKAILFGLAEPIIAVDNFDELVLANPAAEDLFAFDIENVEDRAAARLLHCQKLVDLLKHTCHRKATGSRTEEIEVDDDAEETRCYRVNATKLSAGAGGGDEEGSWHGAVAVLRDVGQQKALQKRNAEFVSAVSHEMKTPLAGIKAYVELLADGDAEDEQTQEEFLQVINSQADRLQRLVDNMLNLARIEAGVVNVNKESRSLNELLEEAVHVVQPSAEAKGVELATDLSPLYLGVLADRDMLLQSAINLLSNAVKYTPEGGHVTLRSRLVDDQVAFEVEDTGVGLDDEDCRRIFDKFYRVNKDKHMASGTGLGLPLAKHIVEDVHGGRLSAKSQLGVGSTFTVTLPGAGQMA